MAARIVEVVKQGTAFNQVEIDAVAKKQGVEIVNPQMTGETHRDRYVLTGDSPLASNNLGKLAAEVLLEDVAKRG